MNRIIALTIALIAGSTVEGSAVEPIRVPIDGVTLLSLSGDAQTVIIGNPEIVDVTPVSLRRIFLVGKHFGQTGILILDSRGNEVLNNAALVVAPEKFAVTLQRGKEAVELVCTPRCVALAARSGGSPATTPTGGGAAPGGTGGAPGLAKPGDAAPAFPPSSPESKPPPQSGS